MYKHDWARLLNQGISRNFSSNPLIDEQISYNPENERRLYESRYSSLNPGQRNAFDVIIASLEAVRPIDCTSPPPSDICFFLHGPGGTGKTFIYNTICN
jgi:hypothetical protein